MENTPIPRKTFMPIDAFVAKDGPVPVIAMDRDVIALRLSQRKGSAVFDVQAHMIEAAARITGELAARDDRDVDESWLTLDALARATIVSSWYHMKNRFYPNEPPRQNRGFNLPMLHDARTDRVVPANEMLLRAHQYLVDAVEPAKRALVGYKDGRVSGPTNRKLGLSLGYAAYHLWAIHESRLLRGFPGSEFSFQTTSKVHSARIYGAARSWQPMLRGTLPSLVGLEKDGTLASFLRLSSRVPLADKERLEQAWDSQGEARSA